MPVAGQYVPVLCPFGLAPVLGAGASQVTFSPTWAGHEKALLLNALQKCVDARLRYRLVLIRVAGAAADAADDLAVDEDR